MPITLPSSLSQVKDQVTGYQPVLLCQFAFQDGSLLYVATHGLNTSEGGHPAPDYFGTNGGTAVNYYARVTQQSLGSLQALSSQGIGRITKVQIRLANADQSMWSFYEVFPGPGFRGAMLTIRLCSWQAGTANFTTDAPIKFQGTCDPAYLDQDGTVLIVEANNSHNTAAVKLPDVPIQNRCPWSFPATAAQRLDGATNAGSQFYQCGYCPDQSGAAPDGANAPIGNYGPPNLVRADGRQITDANGVYVLCDYTRSSGPNQPDATIGCMARLGDYSKTNIAPDGDILHDKTGRLTGRFGGIQWSPGNRLIRSRSYETGNWIDTLQYQNASIFGGYHNIVYGTQWVAPKVANIIEDANSTRCEAVLYFGRSPFDPVTFASIGVLMLTVNGVTIPNFFDTSDYVFDWAWIASGARTGALNAGQGYNKLGDPYGSLAMIAVTVYRDLWDGGSAPNIQALVRGPYVMEVVNGQLSLTAGTASNSQGRTIQSSPAWILMDLLVKANYQYSDLDLDTFVTANAFCNTQIHYRDSGGNDNTHGRFMCEFSLTGRRTAADIIDAVLRSFDAYLCQSDTTGKLQLFIRQTLADQQPTQITGSNYGASIPSLHADGSMGAGFPAYYINESIIARNPANGAVQISMVASPNSQVPNEIVIPFQDCENQYQQDSLTQVEPMSVARCGGTPAGGQPGGAVVPETINILGINNFDQAYRVANRHLWEINYGNEVGDARGTRIFEVGIAAGMRVEHLRIGHIVLVNYGPLGLSNQLFRVTAITPGQNYESCKLTLAWHEDIWYTDAFAQNPQPYYTGTGADGGTRPPYPWRPNAVLPNTSSFRDQTTWNFAVGQQYAKNSDGSIAVAVVISGSPPENVFNGLTPPQVPLQGDISGGSGQATTMLAAVCAEDGSGSLSRPSRRISAHPLNGGEFGVDLTGLPWPAKATGWQLFVGPTEERLCYQAKGDGQPAFLSSTINYNASYGLPDQYFHHFKVLAKPIIFGGILITHVTALSGHSLTLSVPTGFSTDLSGHYLSLYALLNSESVKLPNAAVVNTLPEAITALTQAPGAAANSNEQPVNSMPMRDFLISSSAGGVVTVTEDPSAAFAPIMQALGDREIAITGAAGIDLDQWLYFYYKVTGKSPFTGDQAIALFQAAGVPLTPDDVSGRGQFVPLSTFTAALNSIGFRAITGTGLIAMQALANTYFAGHPGVTGLTVDQWVYYWVQVTGRPVLTAAQIQSILDAAGITDRSQTLSLTDFNAAVQEAGLDAIGPGGFGDIGISVGDIVCIRTRTDIFGPSLIGCSSFVNDSNPSGLGSTDGLKGSVVRIIGGTGAGQAPVLIAGNDSVSVTTASPFQVTPDATSIFIIEASSWTFASEKTSQILESLPEDVVSLSINLANPTGQAFLIAVETVAADGTTAIENLSPYREIYVFGSPSLTAPQEAFIFGDGPGGTPGDISVGMKTNVRIIGAKDGGTITGWDVRPETVPTGSAAIFDILLIRKDSSGVEQTNSIFTLAGLTAPLIIAAAGVAGVQSGIWVGDAVTLQPGDSLQGVVTQKGSSTPGQRVVVNLYWQ